jgi:YhcH/YjgK/YiaL family protein
MIKDILKNADTYYSLSTNLKLGFEWLKNQDLASLKPDKYYIKGDEVFANLQEYKTKDDAKYETHRKYIDIQYMIKGIELVGVQEKADCETCVEYDAATDLEFMNCLKPEFYEELREGEFLVFYPQDAHKPSIKLKENDFVKKVIVKVAID